MNLFKYFFKDILGKEIDINFFLEEYLLALQSEISKDGYNTLFSKQLLKLNDNTQYRCLQFIYFQLLRPHLFANIMQIDSYTLHRVLFYAGYGRKELYTGNNISKLSGYNIVVIYGGEGENIQYECDWTNFIKLSKTRVLEVGSNHKNFSLFNDTKLKVNFNCQVQYEDLGITFNNMRGHVSSLSYFFAHLFDNLSSKDEEMVFDRSIERTPKGNRRIHCMSVRRSTTIASH